MFFLVPLLGMSFVAAMKSHQLKHKWKVLHGWHVTQAWFSFHRFRLGRRAVEARLGSGGGSKMSKKKKKKKTPSLVDVSQFSVESQTAVESSSYRNYEEDTLKLNTEQIIVIQHGSCVFICDFFSMALNCCLSS